MALRQDISAASHPHFPTNSVNEVPQNNSSILWSTWEGNGHGGQTSRETHGFYNSTSLDMNLNAACSGRLVSLAAAHASVRTQPVPGSWVGEMS